MKTSRLKWLIAAMLFCVPLFTRADVELQTSDLTSSNNADWEATVSGQTITFMYAWASCGWYFDSTQDYSAYNGYKGVEIKFKTAMTGTIYLYVAYDGTEENSYEQLYIGESDSETERTIYCSFNRDYYDAVKSIYITAAYDGSDNNTLTLTSATLISKEEIPVVSVENVAYLNTAWSNRENWEDTDNNNAPSGTITASSDEDGIPGATLSFTRGWGGLGWEYYSGKGSLNLSGYSGITVSYTVATNESTTEGTETSDIQVNLFMESGLPASGQSESTEKQTDGIQGSNGTISFTFPTDTEEGNYIDISDVTQIVVQTSEACDVTITSIKLTETQGTSTDYIDDTGTIALVKLDTPQFNTWAGSVSVDESATAANLTYKYFDDGEFMGWMYEANGTNLDISDYSQLVVNYTVKTAEVRTDSKVKVMMELMDKDSYNVECYDNYCVGRIVYDIPSDDVEEGAFDPSKIAQIMFSVTGAAEGFTLQISSIELLTSAQVTAAKGLERNLLVSQLYTWQNLDDTNITPAEDGKDTSATINTATEWTAAAWWVNDQDFDEYWGVEVKFTTETACVVRLSVEYLTGEYDDYGNQKTYVESYSAIGDGTEHTLTLPFLSDYDKTINEIYLIWGLFPDGTESVSINLASAKLLKSDAYSKDYVLITTFTDEGYTTYYNSTIDYLMPFGMKGTKIKNIGDKDDDSYDSATYELTTQWTDYPKNETAFYNESAVTVPASTPLLLQGSTDQNVTLTYTAFRAPEASEQQDGKSNVKKRETATESYNVDNWLHGKDSMEDSSEMPEKTKSDDDTYAAESYYYYMLTYGAQTVTTETVTDYEEGHDGEEGYESGSHQEITYAGWPYSDIGFYWGADEGAAFVNGNNKCWLAIPTDVYEELKEAADASGKALTFVIGGSGDDTAGEDSTTGIATVETPTTTDSAAIYNTAGQRVNGMDKPGLYIVGGRKVIKK